MGIEFQQKKTPVTMKMYVEDVEEPGKQKEAKGVKKIRKKKTKPVLVEDVPVDATQVEEGISALLALHEKVPTLAKTKANLFDNEPKFIYMDVIPLKIPTTESYELRISLPHVLTPDNADVCLIVRDLHHSKKHDYDAAVSHYEKLLEKNEVTRITRIIPLHQLHNENKPYEAKGQFATQYEVYLVDSAVHADAARSLGTRFFKKNKKLIPVNIRSKDVKKEIERGLSVSSMTIHGKGHNYAIKVGYTSFTSQQLKENIFAVVDSFHGHKKLFPGGFENLHSLTIKTDSTMAIPIYLSLRSPNDVQVPVVTPSLPKAFKTVTGELSTIVGGEVSVHPGGKVTMRRHLTDEDRDMGFEAREGKGKKRRLKAEDEEEEEELTDIEDDDEEELVKQEDSEEEEEQAKQDDSEVEQAKQDDGEEEAEEPAKQEDTDEEEEPAKLSKSKKRKAQNNMTAVVEKKSKPTEESPGKRRNRRKKSKDAAAPPPSPAIPAPVVEAADKKKNVAAPAVETKKGKANKLAAPPVISAQVTKTKNVAAPVVKTKKEKANKLAAPLSRPVMPAPVVTKKEKKTNTVAAPPVITPPLVKAKKEKKEQVEPDVKVRRKKAGKAEDESLLNNLLKKAKKAINIESPYVKLKKAKKTNESSTKTKKTKAKTA